MKLTKQQRHIAYIIMLAELEAIHPIDAFFCNIMHSIGCGWGGIMDDLPELLKHKPERNHYSGGWFGNDEKSKQRRINILNQCIIETY